MPVAEVVNAAKGTTLGHGTGSPGSYVYTLIAQIVAINELGREVGTRNTTILTSAAETFAATIVKNGTLSGKILYDPKGDSHKILDGLIATPTTDVPWEVTLSNSPASTLAFLGILTKFSPTGIEVEANLEADFEIKISGAVTVTP